MRIIIAILFITSAVYFDSVESSSERSSERRDRRTSGSSSSSTTISHAVRGGPVEMSLITTIGPPLPDIPRLKIPLGEEIRFRGIVFAKLYQRNLYPYTMDTEPDLNHGISITVAKEPTAGERRWHTRHLADIAWTNMVDDWAVACSPFVDRAWATKSAARAIRLVVEERENLERSDSLLQFVNQSPLLYYSGRRMDEYGNTIQHEDRRLELGHSGRNFIQHNNLIQNVDQSPFSHDPPSSIHYPSPVDHRSMQNSDQNSYYYSGPMLRQQGNPHTSQHASHTHVRPHGNLIRNQEQGPYYYSGPMVDQQGNPIHHGDLSTYSNYPQNVVLLRSSRSPVDRQNLQTSPPALRSRDDLFDGIHLRLAPLNLNSDTESYTHAATSRPYRQRKSRKNRQK